MAKDHPFAQYLRIIGRGERLSRPLSEDEMLQAGRMILADEVEPVQLGAFLLILRMRSEEPEEGAGFVRAIRETLSLPPNPPEIDLDWASYSGKKRRLPWFLLAIFILAGNGVRIFMQAAEGHTEGRLYTRKVLQTLGLSIAHSFDEAADHIRARNFAFLPLADLSPPLQRIIALKSVLGLRTPMNTFARMINPFSAPYEIQCVFHPAYRDIHRQTARILGQPHMAVFKGEGGEIERRPHKSVLVESLNDGKLSEEEWPPLMKTVETLNQEDEMDISRLSALWRGDWDNAYATNAVIGTLAIALRLLGLEATPNDATHLAKKMWAERERSRFLS
jgi:anthranilate phosphoribosyltransferase